MTCNHESLKALPLAQFIALTLVPPTKGGRDWSAMGLWLGNCPACNSTLAYPIDEVA